MLSAIKLVNFRGYEELNLSLEGRLMVLVGDNAQGKTNFLRAVEVLGLGDSRGLKGEELIRFGASYGTVEGHVQRNGYHECLLAGLSGRGARLSLNGKVVSRPRWVGRLPVLFIGPEDRDQVTGPPSARRALLDELLEQCEPAYLTALREYRRALRQRNRALAGLETQLEEIEIWEEPLARAGGILLSSRVRALSALAPRAKAWHRELLGLDSTRHAAGDLAVSYQTNVTCPSAGASPEAWGEAFREALVAARERERAWGTTLVGPHRDEVAITLNGHILKGAGSSGEIWSAILALTLASAEHLGQQLGSLPLLLLDDVLTALDASRRDRLLGVLKGLPQALLTAIQCPVGVVTQSVYEVRQHRLTRLAQDSVTPAWESRDRDLYVQC